jgi:hypothetical protein
LIVNKTKTFTAIKLAALLSALGIVCAIPALARTGQSARPEATIESTRHDFGEAFAGEELMHVFTVRNTGDAPLELSQTKLLGIRRPTSATAQSLPVKFAPASAAPG